MIKLIFSMLLVGSGWWLFFLSPYFEISSIKISGSNTIASKKIKATAKQNFKSHSHFFSSQNLPYALLKKEELKTQLQKKFPVFKQIKITPDIPADTIKVDLTERKRLAILKQKGGSNFYFDKHGVLFAKAPEYEGSLMTLVETEDPQFKKGDQLTPKNLRNSIIELLKSNYLKKELNLSKIDIKAKGKELHAHILNGARLKFSITEKPLAQNREIKQLKKVMERKVKSKRNQLKYIDLRVQNRAYIKYEEENKEENKNDKGKQNNN